MSKYQFFLVKQEDRIATVTINHPPANALSSPLLRELSTVFDELESNEEVKVIVLHGQGRFFAAGADIKEFTTVETGADFAQLAEYGQKLFDRIEQFKKPVIAAIHGAALGGGLELAMACHIRLVSTTTKLGLPELQLGLIPGFAGSQRLPRYVGVAKAAEMLLTSEPISGSEAVSLGLANHAYNEEELMERAYELAKKLTKKSAVSMKLALELLTYANNYRFEEGVNKEAELFGIAFDSEDGQEGIKAFIEKRPPQFKDR
ncbi:enoyl-CoA hydratase [Anaerobacillus sp. CMMVII]|uniref:enoyl-CoA hydratase n=1 Tax=Anaerobacillus sp. CMMVII TaxID=2755588 RepID=UPI0021B83F0B|nr:enoyl-CoA hydratase [Anaerobacillus sp. CMMVII]MCT8137447.1 enoyl-CoA hydratase [Anaerobacillus sp. CMMVII]